MQPSFFRRDSSQATTKEMRTVVIMGTPSIGNSLEKHHTNKNEKHSVIIFKQEREKERTLNNIQFLALQVL
jgi:prephenate dehydrogenase